MSLHVDLRSALSDWTDFDVAEYALARCLGVVASAASGSIVYKHVFWTDNLVGNGLGKILECMIMMGAIETNDDCQYRWNRNFDRNLSEREETVVATGSAASVSQIERHCR